MSACLSLLVVPLDFGPPLPRHPGGGPFGSGGRHDLGGKRGSAGLTSRVHLPGGGDSERGVAAVGFAGAAELGAFWGLMLFAPLGTLGPGFLSGPAFLSSLSPLPAGASTPSPLLVGSSFFSVSLSSSLTDFAFGLIGWRGSSTSRPALRTLGLDGKGRGDDELSLDLTRRRLRLLLFLTLLSLLAFLATFLSSELSFRLPLGSLAPSPLLLFGGSPPLPLSGVLFGDPLLSPELRLPSAKGCQQGEPMDFTKVHQLLKRSSQERESFVLKDLVVVA